MTEHGIVEGTPVPRTRTSLAINLKRLGVMSGGVLIVHASLSAIGWVSGGAQAVVEALLDALGAGGTLVMPAHSTQLTDPAGWENPPVPAKWHEAVRASLPAFDPYRTPTRGMGAVAELFRVWPGALRGAHPTLSFAALGPEADRIVLGQPLSDPLGEDGPLGHLHRLGAQVLLLGVGHASCTVLHLAERRAWPDGPRVDEGAPMLVDGERHWIRWRAPRLDADLFPAIGRELEESGLVRIGLVGSASCKADAGGDRGRCRRAALAHGWGRDSGERGSVSSAWSGHALSSRGHAIAVTRTAPGEGLKALPGARPVVRCGTATSPRLGRRDRCGTVRRAGRRTPR